LCNQSTDSVPTIHNTVAYSNISPSANQRSSLTADHFKLINYLSVFRFSCLLALARREIDRPGHIEHSLALSLFLDGLGCPTSVEVQLHCSSCIIHYDPTWSRFIFTPVPADNSLNIDRHRTVPARAFYVDEYLTRIFPRFVDLFVLLYDPG